MADFLVRVELFDADSEQYDSLYEGMELLGFSKKMPASDGTQRNLPTGTYVGAKNSDAASVRDSVRRVADPLSSKAAAVFVCEFTGWASYLYS